MSTFKTIHTLYGLRALAQAEASGTPINLTHIAVGDGNGNETTPADDQASLVRERFRGAINRTYQDTANPTKFICELLIPANVGGFTLREFGVIDAAGSLFVVGNLPSTYKPVPDDGAFSDTVLRVEFWVQNASVVTVQADPNVAVATQAWIITNITSAALIPGGTTGQLLRKTSNADGDTEWGDPDAMNVTVDTIEETQTLAAAQLVVDLAATSTRGLALYINGERLRRDQWTAHPLVATRLTLATSYPDGTKLIAAQNEPTGNAPAPLERSRNLSDLENVATARAHLDIYSKAEADRICPIGTPSHFPSTTLPTGWLVRNGAAVSRTAYWRLFEVIGTSYGGGDGFNTFNVPDDRGGFDGNADLGRGLDSAMAMGAWRESQNKVHSHSASSQVAGSHSHSYTDPGHSHDGTALSRLANLDGAVEEGRGHPDWQVRSLGSSTVGISIHAAGGHNHAITVGAEGGLHARPNTRAYMPIIRAY